MPTFRRKRREREREREWERERRGSLTLALTLTFMYSAAGLAGPPAGRNQAPEMTVRSSVGTLDQAAVEGPLNARATADIIQGCYRTALAKFRFLDGKLGLKVRVQVDGAVRQVDTIMPIGSFEVERCVADVVRGLRFGPPRGDAEAEFDYVWEFRSPAPVQYWEDTDVGKVFAQHRAELKACGPLAQAGKAGKGELPVTFYVIPGGKVGSVSVGGIGLGERHARCLADRVAKWRFPDPLGTVAHAAYVLSEKTLRGR